MISLIDSGSLNRLTVEKQHIMDAAMGRCEADLVLKNATYVNIFLNELSHGDIAIADGIIVGVGETYHGRTEVDVSGRVVLPGLIDAHIHLESSLLAPAEFTKALLIHGTTTLITDPHEITNVMGTDGIEYILQATEGLPVDVMVMVPSCVPATPMDESGSLMDYQDIEPFYQYGRVLGLAEMMDTNGVINGNPRVLEKLVAAQYHHGIIDGHASGLTNRELNAYIAADIYSDHECSCMEEALAKLGRGMSIMIREGTAARNLDALLPLLQPKYHENCMFCTDDIHPSDLLDKGDIDHIIRRALKAGVDPIIAIKCATLHAARYFGLRDRGIIAPGHLADMIVVDSLEDFNILSVYKKGVLMYDRGMLAAFPKPTIRPELLGHALDTFHVERLTAESLLENQLRAVIEIIPGEIITRAAGYANTIDVDRDILKIVLVERHKNTGHIGIGYIKGYGLRRGAVATSISHDSHNIIAVGTNEAEIAAAVNRVMELNGGIVVWDGGVAQELPLQIAGIMSREPLAVVNEKLEAAEAAAFTRGVERGVDPFMTLSFMALPVIPTLRITTRGVYDAVNESYI